MKPEDKIKDYDDLVKFVNNSSYRVNVLRDLSDGDVKMPKDIAADCNILPNHISNVLTLLKNLGLLECINPEVKKGRLYRLSSEGKDIIKDLK